MYCKTICYS